MLTALLWASGAAAAAEVQVVLVGADPPPGGTLSVLVRVTGFPRTLGATLGLTFNEQVVSVTDVANAQGSPLALSGNVPQPFPSGTNISMLGPEEGTPPSGDFDVLLIRFARKEAGDPQIVLADNGKDLTWVTETGDPIPVRYRQLRLDEQLAVPAEPEAAPPPAPAAAPQASAPAPAESGGSLTTEALGIIALGLLVVGLAVWLLWRGRR